MRIEINNITFELLPEKVLYLPEQKILCVSDWHLGKAAHFRKFGIPVPQPNLKAQFELIKELVRRYDTDHVVFLGDLFHSAKNNDWYGFAEFVLELPNTSFQLIKGNHDVIPEELFDNLGIAVHDSLIAGGPIIFTHEPLFDNTPDGLLNIAGHIHPGYTIDLNARQRFTFPCFYYSLNTLVLPSFGSFTGLHRIRKKPGDLIYCVTESEILSVVR